MEVASRNGGIVTGIRASLSAVVTAGMLLAATVVPAAKAADERMQGWMLTRQGSASRAIEGLFTSSGVSEDARVHMMALTGRGAQRRVDYRFTTTTVSWGVDAWAQFHAGPVESPGCVAACTVPVGVPQNVWISSQGRAISSRVYIYAYDVADPELTIDTPGWTVKRFRPSMRWLSSTAGGDGVSAAHTSVGTYRGGQLAGGSFGSLAMAHLPCANRGYGTGTLSGGRRPWKMSCEVGAFEDLPRKTVWRVEADTVGWGYGTAPLIVVDFPPE